MTGKSWDGDPPISPENKNVKLPSLAAFPSRQRHLRQRRDPPVACELAHPQPVGRALAVIGEHEHEQGVGRKRDAVRRPAGARGEERTEMSVGIAPKDPPPGL